MWNEAGFSNNNQFIKIQSYPDEAPSISQNEGEKYQAEIAMDIKLGLTIS